MYGSKPNVITIEKNIPLPELKVGRDRMKYVFLNAMEVGDSFCINGNTPDYSPKAVRSHVYAKHSKTTRRYAIRTIKGNFRRPSAIRVWRVL